MLGIIYKITNLINGKSYIGKTERNLQERWQEHLKDAQKIEKQDRAIYRAINKYGFENFSIEQIEEADSDLLSEREIYWISHYNTYKEGYNSTLGGEGKTLYDYQEIIKLFNDGLYVYEIQKILHCDKKPIESALKANGINGRTQKIEKQKIPTYQYDKEGKLINTFISRLAAAQHIIDTQKVKADLSSVASNIGRVARGERKSCYGFYWKNQEPII